jgi:hypothetical protein
VEKINILLRFVIISHLNFFLYLSNQDYFRALNILVFGKTFVFGTDLVVTL